jgi:hypothetical protein
MADKSQTQSSREAENPARLARARPCRRKSKTAMAARRE